MRAAAGGEVERFHFHQPQGSAARRFLAERERRRFGLRHEADAHGSILPNDAVRFLLGGGNRFGRECDGKVDRAGVGSEMEALGACTMHVLERGRQHVLTRVLLHVIEPPRPVDLPAHLHSRCERRGNHVRDAAIVEVDHVFDPYAAENPGVEGLPAGGRIERRTIEHDRCAAVTTEHLGDRAGEGREVGVGVVETEGHLQK